MAYDGKKLKKAVERYFQGISRVVTVTEPVATGEKDEDGHAVYRNVSVKNRLGRVVKTEEWIIPPSIADLRCELGLTEEEWAALKDDEATGAICAAAEERVERYLRRELLTRPNKAIKGVVLTLQRDFGFDSAPAEDTGGGLEELLG